jgi:hypothetical protein
MMHLPRPKSPEPALFETAVKPRTPFRLERAVIKVSAGNDQKILLWYWRTTDSPGVPHNPNPDINTVSLNLGMSA